MLIRSLMTVLGLAIIGSFGGCCTSGTCGTTTTAPQTVYSDVSYAQSAPSDCGCGCSAASSTSYDSYAQPTEAVSDSTNFVSQPVPAGDSPYYVGNAAGSANSPAIIEPPTDNSTSGFSAGSSTRAINNALPGNLLPNNQ